MDLSTLIWQLLIQTLIEAPWSPRSWGRGEVLMRPPEEAAGVVVLGGLGL